MITVRTSLDLRRRFKEATEARGETMAFAIRRFIKGYVRRTERGAGVSQ